MHAQLILKLSYLLTKCDVTSVSIYELSIQILSRMFKVNATFPSEILRHLIMPTRSKKKIILEALDE